jgi:hypothetical protein
MTLQCLCFVRTVAARSFRRSLNRQTPRTYLTAAPGHLFAEHLELAHPVVRFSKQRRV